MRSEKHGTVFDKNRMLCQCFLYIFQISEKKVIIIGKCDPQLKNTSETNNATLTETNNITRILTK